LLHTESELAAELDIYAWINDFAQCCKNTIRYDTVYLTCSKSFRLQTTDFLFRSNQIKSNLL